MRNNTSNKELLLRTFSTLAMRVY